MGNVAQRADKDDINIGRSDIYLRLLLCVINNKSISFLLFPILQARYNYIEYICVARRSNSKIAALCSY